MALLKIEFVMGTENKIQASNPAGEHVISECCSNIGLGTWLFKKKNLL